MNYNGKVVTLCGSRKFLKTMMQTRDMLIDHKALVFMPDSINVPDFGEMNKEQIDAIHAVHEFKMESSDVVLFINENGYMGDDTKRELAFCVSHDIPIELLHDEYKAEDYLNDFDNEDAI